MALGVADAPASAVLSLRGADRRGAGAATLRHAPAAQRAAQCLGSGACLLQRSVLAEWSSWHALNFSVGGSVPGRGIMLFQRDL